MGFDIIPGDAEFEIDAGDLNPLHWINKANHAFGSTLASNLEFLGITDPAVDPDGIREIAKKWRALAKGLDAAARDAETALTGLEWEGKAAKALHKRAKTARTQATEMADSLRKGAKALDDFADEAHDLLTEIGVILAEIAEFEIAGLALSVLTGGLSAIAGSLAAGARAAKVVALIARIEKSGSRMARVIRTVMEAIRGLERALKALGEIKTIAKAGKLAGEGMKFSAFDAALQDPGTFKDPSKLAETLAMGAAFGVGAGGLGKLLGKGLGKLKPSDLAKLSRKLGLDGSGLSRLKFRPGEAGKVRAAIRALSKYCDRDPIDVATGEMLLPQNDVELPGTLPLILQRTHVSSYRWGGWFGPSWASTLDQRLQADDAGITYATADGARVTFPLLAPDAERPVRGESGSRLLLGWDAETDGALCVTDPESGLVHTFHSPRATDDGDAVDLPLQSITDPNGHRVSILYADDGTPVEVVHTGGYRVAVDRHPTLPRIRGLRLLDPDRPDASGTTLVSYGYNDDGHLAELINSSGRPMRFTYDEVGRITSWTDRNGTSYRYTYDEQGRVVLTQGSANCLAGALTYDDTTWTTSVTDSLGHTTRYEHNEFLRLIRQTDPLGNVMLQEWDADHRLVAVTDPLGHSTRYSYDEHGRVTSVITPDGHETKAEYNRLGLTTALTGPDGSNWRQEYDARGNRTAFTDPAGATTGYAYDSSGRLTAITDPVGNMTRIRCDQAGLLVTVTDPLNAVTQYGRDAFGRVIQTTDPLGHTTELEWTVEGHVTRRTMPDGSTEAWTYDGEGNCTSHVDAAGGISRFEYTHFDMLSARTTADGARHEFQYDSELRLTQVINPQGLSWTYTYDAAGRLVSETDFDDRICSYEHDAAGRLIARVNPLGETVRYERDRTGQIIRKRLGNQVITYDYDLSGQLSHAAGPGVALTLTHDRAGNLTSETVNGRITSYEYDSRKLRTARITPSGAMSSYEHDGAGNRTHISIADHSLDFSYDALGQELSRAVGESVTLTHAFDGSGRLMDQSTTGSDSRLIQRRSYAYRPDGYVLQQHDRLNGARSFTLDPAGRVTHVRADDWVENYAYDSAGNQTSASWPTTHPGHEAGGPRTYDRTRIIRAGRVRYEHDAAGRVTLRQKRRLSRKPETWRYTWNAEDQLTSVVTPDGTQWRYLYDPLGRRIAKQRLADDGETIVEQTDFTWDDTTLCEQTTASRDVPNPVTLTWEHQSLQPVAQSERISAADTPQCEIDSRFFSVITDLVGAPTELINEAGEIAWRTRTTLWGITAWEASSSAYTPLRFPGQYHDPETGLCFNYFRHYDPETGHYASLDPLGLDPAPNPTTYVHNPLTWTDHLGLAPLCKYWKLVSYRGQRVYQRDDLVLNNPEAIQVRDRYGRSNLKRMQQGLAPLGPDGRPMNVHHMLQTENGPMAELTHSMHFGNYYQLHWKAGTKIPSGIDRDAFDLWRKQYWKDRAKAYLGSQNGN
ncbi:DUF6531 domain-containing protein [Streptomyces sp. G5(2025)]|uniref:DUF6531 domain-containing protein n=1 Tax=Streptomyces sp. G5(2025) TaxID=3406628 RepID=UPI003C285C5E